RAVTIPGVVLTERNGLREAIGDFGQARTICENLCVQGITAHTLSLRRKEGPRGVHAQIGTVQRVDQDWQRGLHPREQVLSRVSQEQVRWSALQIRQECDKWEGIVGRTIVNAPREMIVYFGIVVKT